MLDKIAEISIGDFSFAFMLVLADYKLGKSLIKFCVVGALIFFSVGYLGHYLVILLEKFDIFFSFFLFILLMIVVFVGIKILFLILLFFPSSANHLCKKVEQYIDVIMIFSNFFENSSRVYYFFVSFVAKIVFSFSFALGTFMTHDPIYSLAGIGMVLDAIAGIVVNIFSIFRCKLFSSE